MTIATWSVTTGTTTFSLKTLTTFPFSHHAIDFLLQVHDLVILLLALAEQLFLAFEAFEFSDSICLFDLFLFHVKLSVQTLQFDIEIFLETLPFAC